VVLFGEVPVYPMPQFVGQDKADIRRGGAPVEDRINHHGLSARNPKGPHDAVFEHQLRGIRQKDLELLVFPADANVRQEVHLPRHRRAEVNHDHARRLGGRCRLSVQHPGSSVYQQQTPEQQVEPQNAPAYEVLIDHLSPPSSLLPAGLQCWQRQC
jgi:hypothetical protein